MDDKTMVSFLFATMCVTAAQATPATITVLTPGKLTSARRDMGAAVAGNLAIFAGGCSQRASSSLPAEYDCGVASSVVEAVDATGTVVHTAALGAPRAWPAACSPDNATVVFAGGGVSGAVPHSTLGDAVTLSASGLTVKSSSAALALPRWGIATAAVGGTCYFGGGKVTISGYQNAYTTAAVDTYSTSAGWRPAPFNLSVGRESATAVGIANTTLAMLVGWEKKDNNYQGCPAVDVFTRLTTPGGGALPVGVQPAEYDIGAAAVADYAYLVDSKKLYKISSAGVITTVASLPFWMEGAIPGAKVATNGVTIGSTVCFFGVLLPEDKTGSLHCFDGIQWSSKAGTVGHMAGAMVAIGNKVLVAGGFNPADSSAKPTDVIDVFQIGV